MLVGVNSDAYIFSSEGSGLADSLWGLGIILGRGVRIWSWGRSVRVWFWLRREIWVMVWIGRLIVFRNIRI